MIWQLPPRRSGSRAEYLEPWLTDDIEEFLDSRKKGEKEDLGKEDFDDLVEKEPPGQKCDKNEESPRPNVTRRLLEVLEELKTLCAPILLDNTKIRRDERTHGQFKVLENNSEVTEVEQKIDHLEDPDVK